MVIMNSRVATRFGAWTFPFLPASSRCIVWQPLRLRRTRPPTRGSNTPQPYGRNCPCNSTCTCNPSVKRPFASSHSSKQKKDGEGGAKGEHLLLKTRLSTQRSGVDTTRTADRCQPGFAPVPKFLRSQITCRLYESLSDETVNRSL